MRYYLEKEERAATTSRNCSLSLTTIGILTGIVLCILKACNVLNITWFWATFPFWIVPAVTAALLIIIIIVAVIYAAIAS